MERTPLPSSDSHKKPDLSKTHYVVGPGEAYPESQMTPERWAAMRSENPERGIKHEQQKVSAEQVITKMAMHVGSKIEQIQQGLRKTEDTRASALDMTRVQGVTTEQVQDQIIQRRQEGKASLQAEEAKWDLLQEGLARMQNGEVPSQAFLDFVEGEAARQLDQAYVARSKSMGAPSMDAAWNQAKEELAAVVKLREDSKVRQEPGNG